MKQKKILVLIISLVFSTICLWGGGFNTNKAIADSIISAEIASSIEEVKNRAAINYSTEIESTSFFEFEKEVLMRHLELKSITLDHTDITLETNGRFVFIDLIGATTDGQFINLSQYADWSSSNENVATAHMGRIIAEGKGEAIVNVKFQEFEGVIDVKVLNEIDIKEIINGLEESHSMHSATTPTSISPTERMNIVNRAAQMVDYTWTPTKDLRGWRNEPNYKFVKGVTYIGIPYTQTEYQVNLNGFINSLGYSDFYDYYTRFNIIMPKFGNDCSGFVSFSWDISRHTTYSFIEGILYGQFSKVGNYDVNNPDELSLRLSYYNLQYGDAVVKEGHTFLISGNDQSTMNVYVYEQTPPKARYIIWNYEQMALSGYMPFSK